MLSHPDHDRNRTCRNRRRILGRPMKIDEIEIHTGSVAFNYQPIRKLEVRCEAVTHFSKAPTIEDVNHKFRELAAGIGANAVIDVRYKSGISWTSWRSVQGYGLAVHKLPDDIPCAVCGETIKRLAKKCRFCGSEIAQPAPADTSNNVTVASLGNRVDPKFLEPLRSTDNAVTWWLSLVAFVILRTYPRTLGISP